MFAAPSALFGNDTASLRELLADQDQYARDQRQDR